MGVWKRRGDQTRVAGWPKLDEVRIDNDVIVVVDVCAKGFPIPRIESGRERERAVRTAPVVDRTSRKRETFSLSLDAALMEVDHAEERTGRTTNLAGDRPRIADHGLARHRLWHRGLDLFGHVALRH